jgi:2,4-dienoyl-CoA reductase-like NADH-dependent reductase (Old Yellow Enzyme family)
MAHQTFLFSPMQLRGTTLRNRIFVSPMCQYSCHDDGMPTDWHFVHLGSRAVGGAGLVIVEATAVSPEGRISPGDTGIWTDAHTPAYARIVSFVQSQGSASGIQLAHAGRKASTQIPWKGGLALAPGEGAWETVGPSAIPFNEGDPVPREMDDAHIQKVVTDFAAATRRALAADFDVLEIHMAHGYLLHEFLSPLTNRRTDGYGGTLANRMRLPLQVAAVVRKEWPEDRPLFVRISATDWVDGGWDVEQSIVLCRHLKQLGVDLIDCSSGGAVPNARIAVGVGYQTNFASEIRREAGIATGAVGMIVDPRQAEHILATGQADAVLLAREFLRDPYWPLHAADVLRADVQWPVPYGRAKR